MEWMLVKTLMSLFAVLALMVGIIFVLKKYLYKGRASNASLISVDILGHRMLTPKRSVHVLKVLNKVLIVGVTDGGMTPLGEIDDERSLREISERIADRTTSPNNFSEYMEKCMRSVSWSGSKSNGKSGKAHLG